jgi:hypothetical protein
MNVSTEIKWALLNVIHKHGHKSRFSTDRNISLFVIFSSMFENMIKFMKMRWVGNASHIGGKRCVHNVHSVLVGKMEERDHGKVILECIFKIE